jgi:hypothetical protein
VEERLAEVVLVRLIAMMFAILSISHRFLLRYPSTCLSIFNIETPSARRRHGFDTEHGGGSRRSGKTDRRLRRLEKTVESLSHGMILALTQLKSGDVQAEPRPSHESESVSSDDTADDDNDGRHLSAAFAGIRLSENGTETFIFVLVTLDH